MDADTRLHNSKWLIRVNQSPHLTKDRFAYALCLKSVSYRDISIKCVLGVKPKYLRHVTGLKNNSF